jgi:hypothetical protein
MNSRKHAPGALARRGIIKGAQGPRVQLPNGLHAPSRRPTSVPVTRKRSNTRRVSFHEGRWQRRWATTKNLSLHYAAKDAVDFVSAAKAQENGLYSEVITHRLDGSLRDKAATKQAILEALDWIEHAVTSTDVSADEIKSPDQHYRLLPYDYDPAHMRFTTIADTELQQYLGNVHAKTLFFFDTCHSAGVLGSKAAGFQRDIDKFTNELRAAENGVVVFASSTGSQLSHEDHAWQNGAFTKALVEGFGGRAARPEAHVISISDLEGRVSRRVRDLTKGAQAPNDRKTCLRYPPV